ncbi:hypothetical protein [Lacinutrix sp. Bg11-31]|uniref:hypothetical protein n=1 Tax=Lacinutrix sp. Bg11-31 TaxID=2057808 RepID=UPI000C31B154|nr:hypothetical protein [Lacinutrix sp. Bg11-31]AUC80670.1 hypothetical protein CW733_00360 [Lacinutrix sp. Bg11-31]
MKNFILNTLVVFCLISFTSCNTDDDSSDNNQQEFKEVVGEWQMYREENLETVIDEWTGTEWTTVDTWFKTLREDSEIILEFKADGTFIDRYADVETANGTWTALAGGSYTFDYIQDANNPNEFLSQTRLITINCDNTYTIEIENNDRTFNYYKKIGTTECGDLVTYIVND